MNINVFLAEHRKTEKKRFLELTGIRNCNTITAYVACVPLELKRVLPELGKPRKTIFESS